MKRRRTSPFENQQAKFDELAILREYLDASIARKPRKMLDEIWKRYEDQAIEAMTISEGMAERLAAAPRVVKRIINGKREYVFEETGLPILPPFDITKI